MPTTELAARMTAAYFADTDGLGLGRPDPEPLATETIAGILELIEELIDSGHAYAVGRRRLLLGPQLTRDTASSRTATSSEMDQGEEAGRRAASETRSTSPSGRPTRRARTPPGTRRGGRGGRAGTSSARRWPRSCWGSTSRSTAAARPDLPPSRERGRPDRGGARRAARPDLDAQRDGRARRARRCRSRSATSSSCGGARALRPGGAADVLLRRPLPPADGVRRGPPGRGGAPARPGSAKPRAAWCRAQPEWSARCGSASSTLWPTTSTRRGPWRWWPSGRARPTAAARDRRRG